MVHRHECSNCGNSRGCENILCDNDSSSACGKCFFSMDLNSEKEKEKEDGDGEENTSDVGDDDEWDSRNV